MQGKVENFELRILFIYLFIIYIHTIHAPSISELDIFQPPFKTAVLGTFTILLNVSFLNKARHLGKTNKLLLIR